MKYAMMTYTMARRASGGKPDMKWICALTRKLGLDAMDQVTLYGYDARDLRRMADDAGVRVVCYTFFADLSHRDRAGLAAGLETVREGLEAARALGAPAVMIPIARKPEYSREEQRKRAIEGFAEAVRLGREYGIRTTTENFVQGGPFITSSDMKELLAAVPEMAVTFDGGCVLAGGEDPCASYLAVKDRVIHAHFKDYVRVPAGESGIEGLDGNRYQAVLIGEGLVDYRSLVRTMKQAGYDGYVNIEYEGNTYPAEAAIGKALEYLKQVESEA